MRLRGFIMLGLAAIMAVGATIFGKIYLTQQKIAAEEAIKVVELQAPRVELIKVVVARVPLRFGNRILREQIKEIDWPANAVPPGVFSSSAELLQGEPRAVLQAIEANEPILASKVTGGGERASLSAIIADDMRAATIRVNDILGVAGFVLPGDHVDIMLTRTIDGSPITDVLLQKVKILGIDQDANEKREEAGVVKSVTIEVSTHQAQKITLATQVGQLSLALRHVAEVDVEAVQRISLDDLNVSEANEIAAPNVVAQTAAPTAVATTDDATEVAPVDAGTTIAITRGTQRREYKVDPEEMG